MCAPSYHEFHPLQETRQSVCYTHRRVLIVNRLRALDGGLTPIWWRSPKVLIPVGFLLALVVAAGIAFGGTKRSFTRATRTPTIAAQTAATPPALAPTVAAPTDSAATVSAINAASPVYVGSVSAPIPTTPPFQNVDFPTQIVAYPADWPGDLHYPAQFTAVEVNSGALPDGTTQSWIAKLRFAGNTSFRRSVQISDWSYFEIADRHWSGGDYDARPPFRIHTAS